MPIWVAAAAVGASNATTKICWCANPESSPNDSPYANPSKPERPVPTDMEPKGVKPMATKFAGAVKNGVAEPGLVAVPSISRSPCGSATELARSNGVLPYAPQTTEIDDIAWESSVDATENIPNRSKYLAARFMTCLPIPRSA